MRKGWLVKNLEECFKLKSGENLTSKMMSIDGVYPVFGGNGIAGLHNEFNLSGSNVIIGRVGALCGNVRHMNQEIWLTDNAFKITDFKYDFDHSFLTYLLNFKNLREYARQAAQPVISNSSLKDVVLEFPKEITEQQRIVSILDEAFAAIATAKANAEQNIKNAKELFESYLQGVFENKGEGWEEKTLGDVANTNGRIGWKGLTAKEYKEQGPLFISVHSLNYGDYVDFRDAFHITQERYDESPEIMLKKDDILICKDGAGIGKLGMVPELPDNATVNSSLLLIRCKKNVTTKYLYYTLLSPSFQSIVQSRLNGATTPHLYQRDIVTFPIWLPNLKAQQAIIQKLDALSSETKRLEAIYQQKIADLDELKKVILQRAFSGELVSEPLIVSD